MKCLFTFLLTPFRLFHFFPYWQQFKNIAVVVVVVVIVDKNVSITQWLFKLRFVVLFWLKFLFITVVSNGWALSHLLHSTKRPPLCLSNYVCIKILTFELDEEVVVASTLRRLVSVKRFQTLEIVSEILCVFYGS